MYLCGSRESNMEWINDIIVAECITVGVGDDVTNLGAAAVATYAAIPHCGSYVIRLYTHHILHHAEQQQ